MVVVIVIITMLTLIGAFMTKMTYNQRTLVSVTSGKRVQVYYRAQAGVVDAHWRIRTNYTGAPMGGGDFTNPAFDPPPYSVDMAPADGNNDFTVDMGPVNASGLRPISSTGLDT